MAKYSYRSANRKWATASVTPPILPRLSGFTRTLMPTNPHTTSRVASVDASSTTYIWRASTPAAITLSMHRLMTAASLQVGIRTQIPSCIYARGNLLPVSPEGTSARALLTNGLQTTGWEGGNGDVHLDSIRTGRLSYQVIEHGTCQCDFP